MSGVPRVCALIARPRSQVSLLVGFPLPHASTARMAALSVARSKTTSYQAATRAHGNLNVPLKLSSIHRRGHAGSATAHITGCTAYHTGTRRNGWQLVPARASAMQRPEAGNTTMLAAGRQRCMAMQERTVHSASLETAVASIAAASRSAPRRAAHVQRMASGRLISTSTGFTQQASSSGAAATTATTAPAPQAAAPSTASAITDERRGVRVRCFAAYVATRIDVARLAKRAAAEW